MVTARDADSELQDGAGEVPREERSGGDRSVGLGELEVQGEANKVIR